MNKELLTKEEAKTLVELLIKTGKNVEFSGGMIQADDVCMDTMMFDVQHLNFASLDDIMK